MAHHRRTMSKATKQSVTQDSESSMPVDLTGRTIDDFHILRWLGQGGMGAVYLAEQRSLGRKVAIKIIREHLASNPTARQRFEQEAKAAAQMTHPNIVQVYAFGEADGITY